MNPKKNVTCVSESGPYFSTTSDRDGITLNVYSPLPTDVSRATGLYTRNHALNGRKVGSHDEAKALGLLYGILHYYGRNVVSFQQSRAARKRGYAGSDRYQRSAKNSAAYRQSK